MYFHLESFGIRVLLSLIVCLIWVWNVLVGSLVVVRKLLLSMKFCILVSYWCLLLFQKKTLRQANLSALASPLPVFTDSRPTPPRFAGSRLTSSSSRITSEIDSHHYTKTVLTTRAEATARKEPHNNSAQTYISLNNNSNMLMRTPHIT